MSSLFFKTFELFSWQTQTPMHSQNSNLELLRVKQYLNITSTNRLRQGTIHLVFSKLIVEI